MLIEDALTLFQFFLRAPSRVDFFQLFPRLRVETGGLVDLEIEINHRERARHFVQHQRENIRWIQKKTSEDIIEFRIWIKLLFPSSIWFDYGREPMRVSPQTEAVRSKMSAIPTQC